MSLRPESVRKKRARAARARGIPSHVSTVGARRRYEALQCLGWRQHDINMQAFGRDRNSSWMKRPTMRLASYQAVVAAYEILWDSEGPSPVTRMRARAAGYSPPMAWEDGAIDDPEAFSSTELDRLHAEALTENRRRATRRRPRLERAA